MAQVRARNVVLIVSSLVAAVAVIVTLVVHNRAPNSLVKPRPGAGPASSSADEVALMLLARLKAGDRSGASALMAQRCRENQSLAHAWLHEPPRLQDFGIRTSRPMTTTAGTPADGFVYGTQIDVAGHLGGGADWVDTLYLVRNSNSDPWLLAAEGPI